ncbi:S8 family serine peptidase, partial [Dyadobacter sp.]|uniref:S8 family serine peptidase n=1 Tax=Dyadobacter sp. TaxID=1914288 RepID=UPI003F7017FD
SGNQSSVVKFPATRSDVLAVGATTNKDKRADFSNNGSGIDVVAPGVGIYTTDGVGIFGEGPGDYITKNGTSEAAAIVSGVAALILSTNPSLNQAQVRQIIESTTDKAGGYAYTLGSGENASQSWNIEMGYGRVNAFKAVQKARGVINGPDVFCSTASYSISGAPSGATTWSTDFPGYVSINAAGLAQRISDRVVTISANIATACGTKQLTKMVTAGSPSYTHITAESGYIGTGQRIIDLCALPVEAEAAYLGPGTISGYEWQIQAHPNWTINKKTANGKIVEINYWQSPANNPEKIYVRAKNTCGWGAYQETLWTIKNCFAAYTIYPNPAEKFINIDFDDVKSENSLPDRIELYKTTYDKLLKSVYPKALYNNHELISNKTISINVSEFERGNYVVHIIKGAETERRQIQLR